MLVQNIKLKMLNAVRRSGLKKSGEAYMFYAGTFLDEQSNVIKMNLSNALSGETGLTKKLDVAKEVPVSVDVAIYQSGFNLRGTIVKLTLE